VAAKDGNLDGKATQAAGSDREEQPAAAQAALLSTKTALEARGAEPDGTGAQLQGALATLEGKGE
jgi:hypothetical protein